MSKFDEDEARQEEEAQLLSTEKKIECESKQWAECAALRLFESMEEGTLPEEELLDSPVSATQA